MADTLRSTRADRSRRAGARDRPPGRARRRHGRRAPPVHAARPARERPPRRGARPGERGRGARGRRLGRARRPEPRDLLPPGARAAAGLHGRAGDRRPRRHARGDGRARRATRRRSTRRSRPSSSSTTRCRWTSSARSWRSSATPSASSSGTASATPSCAGGRRAFDNFSVVPPNTGIVHQVNLEYLARVVETREEGGRPFAFPDTLIGTDSHTTMVNGLGVLGWGVGGIEAEAVLLGEPVSMLVPQVVGFRLSGKLPEGATATDLVLAVTQILRSLGVVGKFVEYFGHGLVGLPLADRATIGNMSPEYGATCGFFPVDEETLRYLRLTGRSAEQVELVEAYCRAQGLFHDPDATPEYSQIVELDLGDVEPSLAGPRRPQDRVPLTRGEVVLPGVALHLRRARTGTAPRTRRSRTRSRRATRPTSPSPGTSRFPTTTRSPSPAAEPEARAVRRLHGRRELRAGARRGRHRRDHELHEHLEPVRHGRRRAPGEERGRARPRPQAVGEVEPRARLEGRDRVLRQGGPDAVPRGARLPHRRLRLHDLHRQLGAAPARDLRGGGRGRAGRLRRPLREPELRGAHPSGGEGELPRLAAARRRLRARRAASTSTSRPSRSAATRTGTTCSCATSGRRPEQIKDTIAEAINEDMYRRTYADVFTGDEHWAALPVPEGDLFAWDPDSTYVRLPPYFEGMSPEPGTVEDVAGARCLVMVGDSVTTDHISPAGAIKPDSPAGRYLRRARRRAQGLQLLRLPPREPRGDGARDVRQRAPAQPARPRERGHLDGAPAGRRGGDHLRRGHALPRRRRADGRARRQGVRLGLVARLGGEGAEPARRARRDRRELRAHPPLEPDRDGHRPAPVPGRRDGRVAGAQRPRGVRRRGPRERRGELGAGDGDARTAAASRSPSPPACASTRRASASTSATAGSCSTRCASSPRPASRRQIARGRRGRPRCRSAASGSACGCPRARARARARCPRGPP